MPYKRIIVPGVPNHFWLRGNNRRTLFSYPWEYVQFLWFMVHAAEDEACAVHSLALMPNHLHILATPPTREGASRFVQRFSQRYAKQRNARRGASGKLFEQRFGCKPVLDERYLATVSAYIELNPVRDRLCAEPEEWKWSTYNLHIGRPEQSFVPERLWTPSDWYLALGPSRYAELVAAAPRTKAPKEREIRVRRPDKSRAT